MTAEEASPGRAPREGAVRRRRRTSSRPSSPPPSIRGAASASSAARGAPCTPSRSPGSRRWRAPWTTRTTGKTTLSRAARLRRRGRGSSGGVVGDGGGRLPLPAVVTLLDSSRALLGVAPVGDPLAEGLVLAVASRERRRCTRRRLSRRRATRTPRRRRAAETLRRASPPPRASAELRALAEADGADGVPAASGSRLTPGTPENGELARAAMALGAAPALRAPRARSVPAPARGWAWGGAQKGGGARVARGPGGAAARGDAGAAARARQGGTRRPRARRLRLAGIGGPSRGRRRRRRARSA